MLWCQKVFRLCWKLVKSVCRSISKFKFTDLMSNFKEIEMVLKNQKNPKRWGCTQEWSLWCLFLDKTYSKILRGPANSANSQDGVIMLLALYTKFHRKKIMEASKKFTRQCNHLALYTKYPYYMNYPKIAVWHLLEVS